MVTLISWAYWLQSDGFWPTSANGWVTLVGVVSGYTATIIVAVWKAAISPLQAKVASEEKERIKKTDEIANRVAELAREYQGDKGKRWELEQFMEHGNTDRKALWKEAGEIRGEMRSLTQLIHSLEIERIRELGEIREAQVAIKEKLDVVGSIKDIGQEILRGLRRD